MARWNITGRLVDIFSRGGEIALGLAKSYSWAADKIAKLYERRFDPISEIESSILESFTDSMVNSGYELMARGRGGEFDIGLIPENPYLFGDEPGGRRFLYIGESQFGPEGQRIAARVYMPDTATMDEIFAAFEAEAIRKAKSGTDPFKLGGVLPQEEIITHILLTERRF